MIYKKLPLLIITTLILTLSSCGPKQEGFLLIFWKNSPADRLEELERLTYGKLIKRYEQLESISDRHILRYYWDEQVIEIDEKLLFEDNGVGLTGSESGFFSIILDGKVIMNGLNRTIISSTPSASASGEIPVIQLDVDYNNSRLYLVLKPRYEKSYFTYRDYSEEEQQRVAIPELRTHFNETGKMVEGPFELPGPFWKIGD